MSDSPLNSSPPGGTVPSYWAESRQPLASLVFVAPLLLGYEAGVLLLGPHGVRNGADVWLRQFLDLLGFGQYFLLPVLTVCILLAWHYTIRQPWRVSRGVLYGMGVESVALALALRLLLHLQGLLLAVPAAAPQPGISSVAGTLVGYFGAGIYEELLFRLILLMGLAGLFRWARATPRTALVAAAVVSSLIFAAAHYIGPYGDAFTTFSFLFRFLAGTFFSALFIYRGFGIAAGAHAGYDVLVGMSAALS